MMGRQSRQMAMIFVDIESLIPETHLLRKIERMVPVFNFFYKNNKSEPMTNRHKVRIILCWWR